MSDMLMIGTTAASSFKRALEVTGHNVANVSTEGYSRQRAVFSSNSLQIVGGVQNGGGVRVDNIERVQADYIQSQLVNTNSKVTSYEESLQLGKQVEGIISGNDAGTQEFLQRYFDSMQNLSSNPTSNVNRQLVIDEAYNLEGHIGNLTSVLSGNDDDVNRQLQTTVTEVNYRIDIVAAINEEVDAAIRGGSQLPNDLLDQRDQAILELSDYLDVTTYKQDDGTISLYTGGGKLPLVSGGYVTHLESGLGRFSNEDRQEVYMSIGGMRQDIGDLINGGRLGGILDFRENMLDPAKNDLGVMLNGLVAGTNWQHYQGYDMNGDAGDNIFEPLNITAVKSRNNDVGSDDGTAISIQFNPAQPAGAPSTPPFNPAGLQPATYGDKETYLENAFDSIGNMKADEYILTYDGANFIVTDRATDSVRGSVAPGTPVEIDGLEFSVNPAGTFSAGDSYIMKPHQAIFEQFTLSLTDPDKIAARGQSPVDSNSDGSILDEVPSAAALGDNVNVANLGSLGSKKMLYSDALNTPTVTFLGGYSKMATGIGMYVQGTEVKLEAQTTVYQQIVDRRESYSGVSLDEEAANLVKFQQAYEAAAQIISTSQLIFDTLMRAVRG
ncbi:MAG: flagellar hook-associated protein 1 [Thiomicrorhabdus sp.]|nr:MAG: flagellar hook-associated protein 1 [Thiomicrorhabdus sp.]